MSNAENTPMAMDDLTADPEEMVAPEVEAAQANDTTELSEAEAEAADTEGQVETVVSGKALTALKNRLRAEAEREVLANHRDEYHEVAARKFGEEGLEFTRRLSDEERAEKQLQELLASNPTLAAKYTAK